MNERLINAATAMDFQLKYRKSEFFSSLILRKRIEVTNREPWSISTVSE
jgi:hypothetical protein